ncbi:MAG: acyltransferase [Tepidiphilus sp.]|nr:acyltransferase [Tepidiphilus sp.]
MNEPHLLGVPPLTDAHPGIDRLGARCRVDPSVSVLRYGQERPVLVLEDDVSLYAWCRLVLGDPGEDPRIGIRIGARTIVNVGCYLSGEGGLEIGADVLIGPHVKLLSAGHQIDGGERRINRNAITRAPVRIGEGAWIGAGAIVLPGVTLGEGAVVAAGSVVRSDVPPNTLAAGVPARLLRRRNASPPGLLRRLLQRLR